jgi:hypothetical protein
MDRILCLLTAALVLIMPLVPAPAAAANHSPEILTNPAPAAVAGYEYTYQVSASDQDGDRLSFSLRDHPQGMTVDFSAGMVRWTPGYNQTGGNHVTVIVSDGNATTEQRFTVNVTAPSAPHPPSLGISFPKEMQVVNTSLYIVGVASAVPGAPPVESVEVKVGNGDWARAQYFSANGSWAYLLDTTGHRNGVYRIAARAYDGRSYSPEAVVNLSFQNPDYVLRNYPLRSDLPLWPYIAFALSMAMLLPLTVYAIVRRTGK